MAFIKQYKTNKSSSFNQRLNYSLRDLLPLLISWWADRKEVVPGILYCAHCIASETRHPLWDTPDAAISQVHVALLVKYCPSPVPNDFFDIRLEFHQAQLKEETQVNIKLYEKKEW
jgi:hypothetical protein